MISHQRAIGALLASSALSLLFSATAQAQAPAPAASDQLEQVVVTATRQSSTVNKAPLSISAVPQDAIDRQGTRSMTDLQKIVPSLVVTNVQAGVAQFTIRGISSIQGQPTTGVYLDDSPLQKRNNLGASANNGTPIPALFDLERVEVLRGPQGTLYGGSSEGGTIRFITPAPSLTRYSGNIRAEVSKGPGDASYQGGVAFGGPIVQDKLGFRASVFERHTGGYIDRVDPYNNGALLEANANASNVITLRAALLWAPTDRLTVNLSHYRSRTADQGGPDSYNAPVSGTFTTLSPCFSTNRTPGTAAPAAVACPANAVPGQTVNGIYQRPAQTYGPFNYLDKYKSLSLTDSASQTNLDISSLSFNYDFPTMNVKAITTYIHDQTTVSAPGNTAEAANSISTTALPTAFGFPLFRSFPDYFGFTDSENKRFGVSQEIRFSSAADATTLTWVGGIFYSNFRAKGDYCQARDLNRIAGNLFGISGLQRFGFDNLGPVGDHAAGCSVIRDQRLKDTELAAFGEANYAITDKLKLTGGIRYSRVSFSFSQEFYGPLTGWNVPTVANSGLANGTVTESPITPKAGLQYQITPNDMLYVSAAKGFRAGGINSPLSASICAAGLAQFGLTTTDIPTTFGSDTVWSYEAGAKMRMLGGRVQINSAAYRIDWTNVQLNVANVFPGCGQSYVANVGSARSQGFELEAQARLLSGLTATFGLGYVDAKYSTDALGPRPLNGSAPTVLVRKGDKLSVPPWTANLGLEYRFTMGGYGAFVRGDASYASNYRRERGPGVAGYLPDTGSADAVTRVDLRAGVDKDSWAFTLFVNNVLNSDDIINEAGGRSGCAVATGASCSTFTNINPFRTIQVTLPREFGAQLRYKF